MVKSISTTFLTGIFFLLTKVKLLRFNIKVLLICIVIWFLSFKEPEEPILILLLKNLPLHNFLEIIFSHYLFLSICVSFYCLIFSFSDCLHPCRQGLEYVDCILCRGDPRKGRVFSMTLSCIWWSNSSSKDLRNVEYSFTAITPRSTLTRSGRTC